MSTVKRGRGRPLGADKDDSKVLDAVADMVLANPKMRPTTAIRRVAVVKPGDAALRRYQAKWKERRETLLQAARERAEVRRTSKTMPARRERSTVDPGIAALVWQTLAVDSPAMQAMRALQNSPTMKAIQAVQNSPAAQAMRALQDSPTMKAIQAVQNSPAAQAMRALQDSPTMKAIQAVQNSPAVQAMQALQNNPAMKAIQAAQNSPAMQAIRQQQEIMARFNKGL